MLADTMIAHVTEIKVRKNNCYLTKIEGVLSFVFI